MSDPLVLYSVNTLLAYRINEQFYQQIHFVWCNPYFSATSPRAIDVQMPPSSTPYDICRKYLEDIARGDRHSSSFRDNRAGLETGMRLKLAEGVITEEQFQELDDIVAKASLDEFRPLLYIIPFEGVRELAQLPRPSQRAHPFSPEYRIERLSRSRFDVLDWLWR
ncbi:MAG: hypothetical protein QOF89_45 [Acidobacteriota bacterium]|jgi:hypothetical protein|nr:hypothetical protein [Acidobacteriota bacterium]